MILIKRDPARSLHIRFNRNNDRHNKAAEYLEAIPAGKKTAFIVHLIEQYKETHPYGPEWEELRSIRKYSRNSYMPKYPIQTNLGRRTKNKVLNKEPYPSQVEVIRDEVDPDILDAFKALGMK